MREPSKGGCGFGRTKCGWHIHDPVSLALRPGHSRTSQTRLRGCGKDGTGGFFEGVYQVDTCICLMYIFREVYCLSACSNRFARSASKQSDEQNECGTPSLYLRLSESLPLVPLVAVVTVSPSATADHTRGNLTTEAIWVRPASTRGPQARRSDPYAFLHRSAAIPNEGHRQAPLCPAHTYTHIPRLHRSAAIPNEGHRQAPLCLAHTYTHIPRAAGDLPNRE